MSSLGYLIFDVWIYITSYEYVISSLKSLRIWDTLPVTIFLVTSLIIILWKIAKYVRKNFDKTRAVADNNETTYESADWLNQLILDVWNNNQRQLESVLEGHLRRYIPKKVNLISFKLGSQPFRIEKVRARPTLESYAGVDLQISFHSNSYMLFQTLLFKPEIKNIKFSGILRVSFRPGFQHESIRVQFLKVPSIDFEATGVSAVFKTVIKSKILDYIWNHLLLPYEIKLNTN